ncbi:MAG: discoidin domain-containing protein, partial [Phycisphaerae bacterium]|nr:discoidin domain-containing protein [Phycisphaerae bacterium]
MKTQFQVFYLTIILFLTLFCRGVRADQLAGVSDITMVGNKIASIRYGGTEYVIANGDLILGTTTRWYIPTATGIPTLWEEGTPGPGETVTGTSTPKTADVGSHADNWILDVSGAAGGMSSIDGINYQETVFPLPTKLIFVFERGGNDNGTVQPILLDGTLGAPLPLKANGAPYANTGVNVGGQNAFGYALITDAPVKGLRITASGHDAMSISAVPTLRRDPSPTDGATDVVRDIVLSWTPGEGPVAYDVYFGTSLADVTDASRTNPKGVLVSQGQTETTYTPAQRLQYGQVYYWRVDEIAAAPNSEVSKGLVWSFTAEPLSYPITNIMVTASSSNPGMVPENTINRSGLNPADQHSVDPTHMWLSASGAAQPTWIRYEFDKAYKLDKLQVWNSNQALESVLGFGAKDVTVECSLDGQTWTSLGDFQFPRAPGAATYLPDEPVDFDGAIAKFVKLTINSNWGGIVAQYGLSEVRFFFVPVQARQPVPAVGATGVDL